MKNDGWIALHRKLLDSRVFQSEGLLKVWIWCLLKANHKEKWVKIRAGKGTTEVKVLPGQFIFGRNSAAKKLKMKSSTVWKRIKKLENMRNCDIESNTQYSLVTLVNWGFYQSHEKKGTSKGTAKEQPRNTNNNDNNEKNITPSLSALMERYSDQNLINQVFDAIRSTRKSNKIEDNVLLAQLQKWEEYPIHQIEAGIRVYLEKGYADQGKDEKYLLGIIRKQKAEEPKQESTTGSPALDAYYARNSH